MNDLEIDNTIHDKVVLLYHLGFDSVRFDMNHMGTTCRIFRKGEDKAVVTHSSSSLLSAFNGAIELVELLGE